MNGKLEKSFQSKSELVEAFVRVGCSELLVKILAKNQDNEKNQIYLGQNLNLSQYFPGEIVLRELSQSKSKLQSKPGTTIVALDMDFSWLWPNEKPSLAPSAKIVEYSQYPEARFTGFLTNSLHSPDALRRDYQDSYGRRALVLGISGDLVYGAVVTDIDNPELLSELASLPTWPLQKILRHLTIERSSSSLDMGTLLGELRGLAGEIHRPQRLKTIGDEVEYIAPGGQAGGWTLEALLGIPMNSKKEPDKYGFEIKAVGGERTSLITTEPDFGYRFEKGVSAYIAKFGRTAKAGNGKTVFSGVHRCNELNPQTGAVLTIENWDFELNEPTGKGQPNIALIYAETGEIISGWTFKKIGASWSKKHAGAVYVQSQLVSNPNQLDDGYFYGPVSYFGVGTSSVRLLKQIAAGVVILDPGDSQTQGKSAHARTQWRIAGNIKTLLPNRLEPLYDSLTYQALFEI